MYGWASPWKNNNQLYSIQNQPHTYGRLAEHNHTAQTYEAVEFQPSGFQVPTGWTVFQTPSTPWASFNRPMGDVWARLESHGVLDGWTSTPRQEDTPLQLMGLGMPW